MDHLKRSVSLAVVLVFFIRINQGKVASLQESFIPGLVFQGTFTLNDINLVKVNLIGWLYNRYYVHLYHIGTYL